MSLQQNKECVFFYGGSAAVAIAGGCTKVYLDSIDGVLATVLGTNGAPKYNAIPTDGDIENEVVGTTRQVSINNTAFAAVDAVGLIAYHNSTYYPSYMEVTAVGALTTFADVDRWIDEQYYMLYNTTGTHSILAVSDASKFTLGEYIVLYDDNGDFYRSYEVLDVDTINDYITVADNEYIYDNGYDGYCAPHYPSGITITLGGAYDDMQTALDNTDADEKSQWLFVGEDLDELAPLDIDQAYQAGDEGENTMLNIVGYVASAYDSLPSGYGYFPEIIANGTYYKTAFDWMKDHTSCSLREVAVDAQGVTSGSVFSPLASYNQALRVMGFRLVNTNHHAQANLVFQTGSSAECFVSVKHCVHFASIGLNSAMYRSLYLANGEVFDCFMGGSAIYAQSLVSCTGFTGVLNNATIELAFNAVEYLFNCHITNSSLVQHHNIFVNYRYMFTMQTAGSMISHNNIFYTATGQNLNVAGFLCYGADTRMVVKNNIVVVDVASSAWKAVIRALTGGQVQMHNCCFYDINGSSIYPLVDRTGNPNWDGSDTDLNDGYGGGNINVDPQFVDPANYDFRLKPQSPCLGAGTLDSNGVATNIGIDQRQIIGAETKHV